LAHRIQLFQYAFHPVGETPTLRLRPGKGRNGSHVVLETFSCCRLGGKPLLNGAIE
jgi:hypothetical protein